MSVHHSIQIVDHSSAPADPKIIGQLRSRMLNQTEPLVSSMRLKTLIVDDEPIARKVLREEIDVGRGLDRSVTNAHILDLPPDIDMSRLAADLSRILAAFQPGTPGLRNDQVAELRAAETAAKNGDGSAVVKFLRNAGASVLELAKKISADVAAAAIKASLGLK